MEYTFQNAEFSSNLQAFQVWMSHARRTGSGDTVGTMTVTATMGGDTHNVVSGSLITGSSKNWAKTSLSEFDNYPYTASDFNGTYVRHGYETDVSPEVAIVDLFLQVSVDEADPWDVLSTVATIDHDILTGIEPDQHHSESHALNAAVHNAGFYVETANGAAITDADFVAPANGMIAMTYDTSTGQMFLWTRSNGVWTYVEVSS
jgi:hypothetical protein